MPIANLLFATIPTSFVVHMSRNSDMANLLTLRNSFHTFIFDYLSISIPSIVFNNVS